MVQSGKRRRLRMIRLGLWAAAAILSVTLVGIQFLGPQRTGTALEKPSYGGPFTLTAHTGDAVSDTDFRGKIMLIYFGFTYCPDVCPTSLQTIGAALDLLPPEDRQQVQPLFISLDPERDTPEALAPYVTHFVPDMLGLTGSLDAVQKVADAYRVAFWKVKDEDSSLPYTVDHASIIFVMDKDGRYYAHFLANGGGGHAGPAEIARSLQAALRGS